jgi:hypothetical protein
VIENATSSLNEKGSKPPIGLLFKRSWYDGVAPRSADGREPWLRPVPQSEATIQDARPVWSRAGQRSGRFDAVRAGHADVHDDNTVQLPAAPPTGIAA